MARDLPPLSDRAKDLAAGFEQMDQSAREDLARALTPKMPCGIEIPGLPHPKQAAFLLLEDKEVLYGGSSGPGKSWALLAAAAQYVCVPGYSALILRRFFPQLAQSGGFIPMSREWFEGQATYSVRDSTWTFPSGATIALSHLNNDADKYKYQGAEVQACLFDELTQWASPSGYLYLHSRVRKPKGADSLQGCPSCGMTLADVPLRMRAACNPGGLGAWVYQRFVQPHVKWKHGKGPRPERIFLPALLSDNPSLDAESYVEMLSELDPVTREQLLSGSWEVREKGLMFDPDNFKVVDEFPAVPGTPGYEFVRYWDLAGVEREDRSSGSLDRDYTATALVCRETRTGNIFGKVQRKRATAAQCEQWVRDMAEFDGFTVTIVVEQEPGSNSAFYANHLRRQVLAGYPFKTERPTGSKEARARPLSTAVENGLVRMVWSEDLDAFLDEASTFPHGGHDDLVDAMSGAYRHVTGSATPGRATMQMNSPQATGGRALPDLGRRAKLTARGGFGFAAGPTSRAAERRRRGY